MLRRFLKGDAQTATGAALALDSQREAQELRLELAAAQRTVESLTLDLDRARRQAAADVTAQTEEQVRGLLAEAAPPLIQLRALSAWGQGKVTPEVHVLVERLARSLMAHGLVLSDDTGQTAAYDPALHQPLGSESISPGAEVRVRLESAAYGTSVIRKAGVERVGE